MTLAMDRRRFLTRTLGAITVSGLAGRTCGQDATSPERTANYFNAATRDAVDGGLQLLASRQQVDGSLGSGLLSRNPAVCGLAGMAFLSAGAFPGRGRFGPPLQRCIDFLLAHALESGFIHSGESNARGPMYGHGFATLFLAECFGNSARPELREALSRAVELIINTQNDEGGWRYEPRRDEADVSVTVCQVMALRAARNAGIHVPKSTIDRAVEYVLRCQNSDGGFMYVASSPGPSAFPRSAAAVVALYSAGIHDSPELTRGLDYLMRFPPQPPSPSTASYYLYGHYYAVQAMWRAGGPYWNAWYPTIRDILLSRRQADGGWPDAQGVEYGTAMACLILRMPESYLPIFER